MPNPAYVATISADGKIFTGWKSLSVRREYGDTVSTFQFTCSDANGEAAQLLPGTPCTITLAGQTALTGWITDRGCAYDADSHDVVIAGKSLTTDVSDSSVPITAGNFDGYSAEQITRAVLAPHKVNLDVVNPPPTWSKPFPYFAVNPGESVVELIERAMRMRGAFMWDDEQGRLCVGQGDPSKAPVAALQEGRNILRCVSKVSDQNAVSIYSTVGQQPGVGDDYSVRNAQGQAVDPSARPNRIRIEHMVHPGDSQDAASYAGLLLARSNWPSVELEVTVAGWLAPNGKLWHLTDNISVLSPMAIPNGTGSMPADRPLGTQAITFSQSSSDQGEGTTTTLSLKLAVFLTSVGHAGVVSTGDGRILGGTPQPATPVAPDTGS